MAAGDRADAGFWRWTLSLIVFCVAFCAIAFAFIQAIPWLFGEETELLISGETPFYDRSDHVIYTIFMFAFIAAFLPAIALTMRVLRLRLSSLIAPLDQVKWRIIGTTAISTFCFVVLSLMLSLWASTPAEDFYFDPLPPELWHYLPVIIIMIAFQASAEELLLRGYFLQMVGRLTKSWWAILLIVGGTFFALHLGNPEVEILGWLAYLDYALAAFLFTIVALVTGRLEYSIGIHIGWNWSVMVFDVDPVSSPDLYFGFGTVVYSGPLNPTLSAATTQILLHLIIGLWCLATYFRQENRLQN